MKVIEIKGYDQVTVVYVRRWFKWYLLDGPRFIETTIMRKK